MNNSIERNIQRIQRLKLSCSINDSGKIRHFHCGREYVEIGGIKWATCNVGAESPTDRGLYFAWGETMGFTAEQVRNGEKRFYWNYYKYGIYNFLTKYNGTDKKTVLEPQDDAATFNMGIGWRISTKEEFQSLADSTISKWVTNYKGSGVNGRLFTDKKDNTKKLFFPAVGFCNSDSVPSVGVGGVYWSSSLNGNSTDYAWYLGFYNGCAYWDSSLDRYCGSAVRGVVNDIEILTHK